MIAIAFLAFSTFASRFAFSAPTSLGSNTLLQNGQAAQQLNAEFQKLKVSDSCNTGDSACIAGRTAQCSNGAWQTQKCPGGNRECFALPSIKSNGTFIACTSEANALSLIGATGAQGGLASNNTSNEKNPSSNSANGDGTVTLTIVLSPGSTATLPPTTQTISPGEASSLVSNFAGGASSKTTSTSTSCTASTSASAQNNGASPLPSSPSGTASNAGSSSAGSGLILLTLSSSTTIPTASATPTPSSAGPSY